MRQCCVWSALVCGFLLTEAAGPSPAVEKWADKNLPVTGGLDFWLDAARQNAARQASGKPALADGQPVDTCFDASGHGRHLVQQQAAARPTFQHAGGRPALRFDGERQHFTLAGLGRSYRDVTVFLVAVPFDNPGIYRAFFAMNQDGKNDYVTGLNLDMGGGASTRWQTLNAEGAGFGGERNLLGDAADFGTVRRLCLTSTTGAGGTRLYVDGKPHGRRDRGGAAVRMDRLTLGARFYTNGGPPQVRGFLDGEIAEVLVYNRVLSDAERTAVDKYLAVKHGQGRRVPLPPRPSAGKPLVAVRNPPPVQVFVPGFTVKQLPVDLTNINNVQYRADGKLVALAYDGNVYLLSDSDGDGLEDRVELFWENKGRLRSPIGMALTPPGYRHGTGLFVASKGKCSLLVDTSGRGKADREIVIAQGWKEIPQNVDALGVAFDPRDGSIYFGLGTADYTNAYQVGRDGKARYRLGSERGTILRVAPDFKSREIICTGIRFSVGLRFNRAGDLFCTDQEGATWLPNGNPFDELLHVQKGRHYGFPPRHPRHLPSVIDEPSVFDYGPQHQSTCGLNFNEPVVKDGPIFGPRWWRSDAFIAGYSRGKLYRTKLVKTEGGYVAQNQLLAALNMLAVDACVSPRGELVVAVHGGGPDWGSGPSGKGKLYKLIYTGRDLPQPVLTWPQGPREVRVAFDRPLDPAQLRGLASRAVIEYGKYVSAGDRFEYHRPGYQVVQDQLRTSRFGLPVLGLQVTADRRTLILTTPPHPEAASYALTLPGLGRPATPDRGKGELPQAPETDLRYDLSGVEVFWQSPDGKEAWTGWLPHPDFTFARRLTAASATHDELWALCKRPGKLTLRSRVNLWDMLRPAVQPGSKIDYQWPAEQVTLVLRSRTELAVKTPAKVTPVTAGKDGRREVRVTVQPAADKPVALEVTLATGGAAPDLALTWFTKEDGRPRALPLHRLLLPWAALKKEETAAVVEREVPELRGGNWARGRKVFFSDQAACFKCHQFGGEGGLIGPDLSNLPQRDYASVLRDVTSPSLAINPDYITQFVTLKNGRVLTGTVRTEGDRLLIGDNQGKVTTVRRADVESLRPSPVSIMPEGLPKQIGPARLKDLLTFLLTLPPRMPDLGKETPPRPRPLAEVRAVLAGAPRPAEKSRPLHVVLVAGRKDHGPGEHDYPAWQKVWHRLLALAEDVRVTSAWDWPAEADLKTADVLVFYQQGRWTPRRARDVDAFLARGGGLVYIHYAVDGGADAPGFARRIGLSWGRGAKFRHGPLDLSFQAGAGHPIARNFDKVHFHDESYWQLVGSPKGVRLLATGIEDGRAQPLFWTREQGKGRVFVSIPGHFAWTFDDPLFRVLLLRGIAWTARAPVDRFNDLVTVGARVRE
jgi:putative heme-binding domain-containing protein